LHVFGENNPNQYYLICRKVVEFTNYGKIDQSRSTDSQSNFLRPRNVRTVQISPK
ncbi:unnamed protein product, partial [Staurois parvus]